MLLDRSLSDLFLFPTNILQGNNGGESTPFCTRAKILSGLRDLKKAAQNLQKYFEVKWMKADFSNYHDLKIMLRE